MRILISGANGFLGKHLANNFPKRNVTAIPRHLLYNFNKLKKFVELENPTFIFHCASFGNMAHQLDPLQTVSANINTTLNLMMASNNVDYKAFIYLSSSSVYGDKRHPMHETNSLDAISFYGCSKISAEYIIRAYVDRYNKPVAIARPFSIYGPYEADYRLIPTIIRCIKNKEPMKMAPGMHDWIYVDDVISGLMAMQENINIIKGKAVNIGTGFQWDNYEVLKHLCYIAKVDPATLPIENIGFMRSYLMWQADNTLLRSFGWKQQYSLSDGLLKCWEAYE